MLECYNSSFHKVADPRNILMGGIVHKKQHKTYRS